MLRGLGADVRELTLKPENASQSFNLVSHLDAHRIHRDCDKQLLKSLWRDLISLCRVPSTLCPFLAARQKLLKNIYPEASPLEIAAQPGYTLFRQSIPALGWARAFKKSQDPNRSAILSVRQIPKEVICLHFFKCTFQCLHKARRNLSWCLVWLEAKTILSWNIYASLGCVLLTHTHRCSKRQLLFKVPIWRAVGILRHPKSLALSTCQLSPAKSQRNEQSGVKAWRCRHSVSVRGWWEAPSQLPFNSRMRCEPPEVRARVLSHRLQCWKAGTVPACGIR